MLAGVNLAFVFLVAGVWGLTAAVVLALMVWSPTTLSSQPRWRRLRGCAVALTGAIVLVLFAVHKSVPLEAAQATMIRPLLRAVGFSYVALRCVELLRAGAEGTASSVEWLDAVNYLFPFHMLAAGPIQSWSAFQDGHNDQERLSEQETWTAIERIVHGLFKKFVLARVLEITFLTGFRAPMPYRVLEIQLYYVWVYLDFSAYSDIAVGAGRLLGIPTPENFARPLAARNIMEFWSRWHMTLSSFIRRNIFIPMQLTLSRRVAPSTVPYVAILSLFVAFILCGMWHAVSLRFALWGAMHALAIVAYSLYERALRRRVRGGARAAYLANRGVRIMATAVTFEFVAFSLAFVAYPATFLR
ncbi:MAG: MBOAT family O-acyltransferase [Gemmatimonadaceae bacterium]